ncbi:HsdR family type I site-specific deoxyribonuclease [uncultured Microbacterium sp.]|uniref:type I restriction endonuclease subunit R n=1 Tax=uncultured Microbacterium sp. TaxID=191216 RepID=UPI002617FA2A|nr:HsdR family type I site-specific deoxyribonuclease [uncultured Microbacterium sp.]
MTEQTFDPREKFQSQVPALQMLVGLGFTPLSPAEALRMRGGRRRNVILDEVLVERTLALNSLDFRGQTYSFDIADAHEAMRNLAPALEHQKGMQTTNQEVYDTLLLGTTITKSIDGDTKSHSFRYIDWSTPANNAFHVTAEYSVERTGSTTTKRCDIVAFVNGIPFIVIENKQPAISVQKAGSQLIGYQNADNIPQLFHYAQLLLSMNRQEARYATIGTPRKFWQTWRDEEDTDDAVAAAANTPLTETQKNALFGDGHSAARVYFDELADSGQRAVSEQDRLLYALCRPERLLDLVRRFTVFDAGVRKVARHQQYFAVTSTMRRLTASAPDAVRPSGVIWHTQGSGKSLTMVMLGKALALESRIRNPRIVIVTDRIDLDKQIRDTFRSCQLEPIRATTGRRLAQLIHEQAPLITTVVNKFDSAVQAPITEDGEPLIDDDQNIFVLVDEGHRTQTGKYGGSSQFNKSMRRMLPRASYLAFTGTPLLKREKNTFGTFGELFHKYTIADAVADGAVVPLLYEGRMVEQLISENVIDRWFDKISEGLTPEQKRDLKRKFSRTDALAGAGQVIRAKAFDISEHYRKHWQGTGFKAQLVAPNKAAAIRFKQVLDEIGHVSSEIVISAPGEDEDHEAVDIKSRDLVQQFWDETIHRFGSESAYNDQIVEGFKSSGDPEILIVVSKLLTGFDAPRNTVLYLCRRLSEHTLLQAIARVNRLFEEDADADSNGVQKEFGYIIDYEGLLGELDKALTTYAAFSGFDDGELTDAVTSIRDQVRLLPARWSYVWELFNTVPNKTDMEALEQFLADDAEREEFYERLSVFTRCLHMALASTALEEQISAQRVAQYRRDWKHFVQLRRAVQLRYQEIIDLQDFEPKIQKLLDDHVSALPAETIIRLVDINDPAALEAVVADTGVSAASRADRIASATRRTIHDRMEEDPALYTRFSQMLQDTIDDYRARRLSEIDYLASMKALAQRVAARDRGRKLPASLIDNEHAASLFETLLAAHLDKVTTASGEKLGEDDIAEVALGMLDIITNHLIVGIWKNEDAQAELLNSLDDYILDELERTRGLSIPSDVADEIQTAVVSRARARFP